MSRYTDMGLAMSVAVIATLSCRVAIAIEIPNHDCNNYGTCRYLTPCIDEDLPCFFCTENLAVGVCEMEEGWTCNRYFASGACGVYHMGTCNSAHKCVLEPLPGDIDCDRRWCDDIQN